MYNDIFYRSPIEASWAKLFTENSILFEYEPLFLRNSKHGYVPDFFLPEFKTWIETKSFNDNRYSTDVNRAERFTIDAKMNMCIIFGHPLNFDCVYIYKYHGRHCMPKFWLLQELLAIEKAYVLEHFLQVKSENFWNNGYPIRVNVDDIKKYDHDIVKQYAIYHDMIQQGYKFEFVLESLELLFEFFVLYHNKNKNFYSLIRKYFEYYSKPEHGGKIIQEGLQPNPWFGMGLNLP